MSKFVGIQSLVTGKDAVIGETAWTSDASTPEAAAADIAKRAKLGNVDEVTPHAKNTYQHQVRIGGNIAFRLLNVEDAPKRKVPAGI